MKGSISNQVKTMVDKSPVIKEMLDKNLLNCSNYAKMIKKDINEGGLEVTESAIIMALRRYAKEIKKTGTKEVSKKLRYQTTIHSGIVDINMTKNQQLFTKLDKFFNSYSQKGGDFLNFIVGTNEFSIIFSEEHKEKVLKIIGDIPISHFGDNLVAFTLVFSGSFMQTPGIIYEIARRLAWDGINVYEIISTLNELTFVVKKKDSLVAYEVIQSYNTEEK